MSLSKAVNCYCCSYGVRPCCDRQVLVVVLCKDNGLISEIWYLCSHGLLAIFFDPCLKGVFLLLTLLTTRPNVLSRRFLLQESHFP